jgi:hypothetical protein
MTTSTEAQGNDVANEAKQELDGYSVERETVAWGILVSKDEAGKVTKTPTIFKSVAEADKLEKEGKATNISAVDVVVRYPKTLEALLKLATTPEQQAELVNNHNRGSNTKVTNRVRAKLLAQDDEGNFTFGESDVDSTGALDMTKEILSESKRKVLTQEEKFDRFIADNNIPADKAAKMKAVWLAMN